jgi:hypothetical protein
MRVFQIGEDQHLFPLDADLVPHGALEIIEGPIKEG